MRAFVNFEVFRSGEYFATAGEGAREGLLPRVNPDMVHQFVLCLERSAVTLAILPEARMGGNLGASNVLDCEMGYDLVHAPEGFVAGFFG